MRTREQIYVLLKDAKWIIAVSVLLTFVLAIPDQIKELYRIAYSNSITSAHVIVSEYVFLHAPIILIGLVVWFGANQIIYETTTSIKEPKTGFIICAKVLPVLLGALPLLGSAFGLYDAVPVRLPLDDQAVSLVGSPWERYDKELDSITRGLYVGAGIQITILILALLLLLAARGYKIGERLTETTARLNHLYLGRWPGIIFTLLLLVAITAAFVVYPVTLPQWIGSFFVVMLFAICVVCFVVNLTLLSMRQKLPIISGLFLAAALFSLLDWTDNHTIRLIENSNPTLQTDSERVVAKEFEKWLAHRPDRAKYRDKYPVYVVAAQGGGIYAAHQTAIFLARLQDICPEFRHHLFAISSVSGGSVGAATFTAALSALDQQILDPALTVPTRVVPTAVFDPCPDITDYRQNAVLPRRVGETGPLENAVRKALTRDFLAPLIAATLFPDFTQRFLFFPVGSFDRARSLEYTLEAAGRSFIKTPGRQTTADGNSFESSILKLWNAEKSIPALLINTTDSGSGRRFLIAPFKMAPTTSQKKFGALVDYQFWAEDAATGKKARDLRLSTAAGISARFPWVTPAATVEDARFPNTKKLKLVDGGYVDNSGVETIFNLKDSIDQLIKQEKVSLNLIVLSGGDFPLRKSFALGETLEPIRSLLNTRTSRAYVAIERATQLFDSPQVKKITFVGNERIVRQPTLKMAILENRFYELPLGWALSNQSRSIIENQSGRFWECTPNESFVQAQQGLAPADCVQLLVYHELDQSVDAVAEQVAVSSYLIEKDRNSVKNPDTEAIIACYRDRYSKASLQEQTFNLEQTGNMRALMTVWRRNYSNTKDSLMAYLMGTAAYESNDFQTRRQSLYYASAERILETWPNQFDDIPASERLPEIEKRYVRKPQELAEKVYGGRNGNGKGNGDGWLYRGRGLAFVTYKESYRLRGLAVSLPQLVDDPELIFIPEINARIFIGEYFPPQKVPEHQNLLTTAKWLDLRKMVMVSAGQRPLSVDTSAMLIADKTRIFDACIKNPNAR